MIWGIRYISNSHEWHFILRCEYIGDAVIHSDTILQFGDDEGFELQPNITFEWLMHEFRHITKQFVAVVNEWNVFNS
jgi:hypothetical protein